jgi:hypothetical protein
VGEVQAARDAEVAPADDTEVGMQHARARTTSGVDGELEVVAGSQFSHGAVPNLGQRRILRSEYGEGKRRQLSVRSQATVDSGEWTWVSNQVCVA